MVRTQMAGDIKVVGLGRGRMVWGDIDLVDQDADDIQIVPAFFCHLQLFCVSVCVFKSLGVFVCTRRSRGVGRTSEMMVAREILSLSMVAREILSLSRHKSITHSRSARKTKGGNTTVQPDRTVHKL